MKKLNQRGALDMMFVVLLVVLLAFGGFVVWRVTAADNETADSAVSTQAGSESINNVDESTEDNQDSTSYAENETDYFEIPELNVQLQLTDTTEDLIASASSEALRANFTLQNFLNLANDSEYSFIDENGSNSCENLASFTVLDEIPENDPINREYIDLEDGRYYYVEASQAICSSSSPDEFPEITNAETEARNAIIELLENNVQSLN